MIHEKKEELLIFLKIIKKDGKLTGFTNDLYSYSDVMKSIEWTIHNKYATIKKQKLELTDTGLDKIKELEKEFFSSNKNVVIFPRTDCKQEKIGIDDIYVAIKKNDISHHIKK